MNRVTDDVLERLGSPKSESSYDRRGMVVGHRLIIVIAGIQTNLRNQTQDRIDLGFVGRDSGRLAAGVKRDDKRVGVANYADKPRVCCEPFNKL